MTYKWLWRPALVLGLIASCPLAVAQAANRSDSDNADQPEQIELFQAMESGDVEVRLIAKDANGGNVLITNKTKKPLAIKLPDAFAGVPVLAQIGGGIGGGLGGGGLGGGGFGGGGGQGLGGGFGGGGGGLGGGGGGFGGGGGVFNVGPEKVGKIKVKTVCLEHGKDDPNPRMKYTIRPIESFTDNAEVIELCRLVGSGRLNQQAAQAAAWHLANGMSWAELARKIGKKHLNGTVEPYFNQAQLVYAIQLVGEVRKRAEANENTRGSKADSLSRR